jgi:metal-responsive CopG/Arc/MetJ family transcriptional regulator
MRSTHTLTISLPPAMLAEVEKVRRAEHRTRSELIREALRAYIDERYPNATPNRGERTAIAKGRKEIRRGRFVTYEQLLDVLDATDRAPRRKVARKKSR